MEDYTKFAHIRRIGDTQLMSNIEYSFKWFLDWSLLGIGSWNDVIIDNSGTVRNSRFDELRLVEDNAYTKGKVWEGVRKDWVWEDNLNYPDGTGSSNPIPVNNITVIESMSSSSGTLLSNSFDNSYNTLGYECYVNYPLGRLIFSKAVPPTGKVRLSYSFRNVQTYILDDAPWWRELQYNSYRPDYVVNVSRVATNEWSIGSNHRVQMPCIVIEATPTRTSTPWELGNNSLDIYQDVSFGIISENRVQRNNLIDLLTVQNSKTIYILDSNEIAKNVDFPLDFRGMTISNPKMYPELVEKYKWKKLYIRDCICNDMNEVHPNLYTAVVRARCEVIYD